MTPIHFSQKPKCTGHQGGLRGFSIWGDGTTQFSKLNHLPPYKDKIFGKILPSLWPQQSPPWLYYIWGTSPMHAHLNTYSNIIWPRSFLPFSHSIKFVFVLTTIYDRTYGMLKNMSIFTVLLFIVANSQAQTLPKCSYTTKR